VLSGCAVEEWRNADLHLDVQGADWDTEDRVRICVDGVGIYEEALGAGRVAFVGIPTGSPVLVSVDLLAEADDTGTVEQRTGRAGPIELSLEAAHQQTSWQTCEGDCPICSASGSMAADDSDNWLFTVRFQ